MKNEWNEKQIKDVSADEAESSRWSWQREQREKKMKIILEFSDEDDGFKAKCALHSVDLWMVLSDIDSELRHRYKHCSISDEEATFIESLRELTLVVNKISDGI